MTPNQDDNVPSQQDTHTDPKHSLEAVVGVNNMDAALQVALNIWDTFVSKYPDTLLNKTFLSRNIGLIRRLLEAVVPNVMRRTIELEDEVESLVVANTNIQKRMLHDIAALSGVIPVTASAITTLGQLHVVMDKLQPYGFVLEETYFQDDEGHLPVTEIEDSTEYTELRSPFWLICAILPNESLSPHIVDHDEYCTLFAGIKNVKQVEFEACQLMAESAEVTNLLSELDLE